jgi:hypothetical protein
MIGVLVTTHNRPEALKRSLPQIAILGASVLVVDDGSLNESAQANRDICRECDCHFIHLPCNRGLAAALNTGLVYWLADKNVTAISYHQDDTDTHPKALEILSRLRQYGPVLTGHDGAAHRSSSNAVLEGIAIKFKETFAAVHIFASVGFWTGVMPIPTYSLGCPNPSPNGRTRGTGSNVDWWLCRDAPRSTKALGTGAIVVPGLTRTFFWQAKDSCWGNSQPEEDAPLAQI